MGAPQMMCFPKSNPNPVAPPWRYPSEWLAETPPGYRDEFHMYTLTTVLTAGAQLTATLATDTAGQCNFYWRTLGVFLFGGAGTPSVRIRDSEGFMMSNTRIALKNGSPFGNADQATPIMVAHRMAPAAKMALDFNETSGAAGVTVVFYFQGVKRWVQDPDVDWRGGAMGLNLEPDAVPVAVSFTGGGS